VIATPLTAYFEQAWLCDYWQGGDVYVWMAYTWEFWFVLVVIPTGINGCLFFKIIFCHERRGHQMHTAEEIDE